MESNSIFYLEVNKIKPNPYQPRRDFNEEYLKELAESIKEYGILEPLIVTRIEDQTEFGRDISYQLLAGERRLMAAKLVGLSTVPALIKENVEEREKLEIGLIENIQREDLNPLEKARGFAQLIEKFGLSQREVALRIGKSREVVANTLRLLQLPLEVQKALEERKISEGHARIILQLSSADKQRILLGRIITNNLTVRQTEEAFKQIIKENYSQTPQFQSPTSQYLELDPLLKEAEEKLEETLKTRVFLRKRGERGIIAINFNSPQELSEIINKICQKDASGENLKDDNLDDLLENDLNSSQDQNNYNFSL